MTIRHSIFAVAICLLVCTVGFAQSKQHPAATISVHPDKTKQTFDGMGCGTIFYGGHITSFGKRKKYKLQQQLYDDLFKEIPTEFLHVMIRPDFEAENDNDDPFQLEFTKDDFKKNRDALKVCKEAKKRRPNMKIYATLYSPPPWMKTNGLETGGGKKRATLKPGLGKEFGEYMWAYLQHMNQEGCPVEYLSICNESDWTHSQPGYFLRAPEHAKLFRILVDYFEAMSKQDPDTPMPKLVAPNGISVIDAAKRVIPALDEKVAGGVDVLGSHDYDRRRQDRWQLMRNVAGDRPVWCTEWCWNGKDYSPDLIKSANYSWSVMCDGFNHGLNAWMAYDYVYPPRPGGEALVHVEWGSSYHRTKFYSAFRQWSLPLTPGMQVVTSKVEAPKTPVIVASGKKRNEKEPIVKAASFFDAESDRLVIHVVNITKKPVDFQLTVPLPRYDQARFTTIRTSGEVSEKEGDPITLKDGAHRGKLGPREMLTLEIAK